MVEAVNREIDLRRPRADYRDTIRSENRSSSAHDSGIRGTRSQSEQVHSRERGEENSLPRPNSLEDILALLHCTSDTSRASSGELSLEGDALLSSCENDPDGIFALPLPTGPLPMSPVSPRWHSEPRGRRAKSFGDISSTDYWNTNTSNMNENAPMNTSGMPRISSIISDFGTEFDDIDSTLTRRCARKLKEFDTIRQALSRSPDACNTPHARKANTVSNRVTAVQ